MLNGRIPQLEQKLAQAQGLQARVDALNALSRELNTRDVRRALLLAEEAYELAQHSELAGNPYVPGVAEALCNLGAVHMRLQAVDVALAQSLEAQNLIQTHALTHLLPQVLANLVVIYHLLGNYSEALELALRQLTLSEEQGDAYHRARALMSLGAIYQHLGEVDKAEAYFADCLPVFQQLQQPYWVALAWSNLGDVLCQKQQFEEALTAVQSALQVCYGQCVHQRVCIAALNNLADIYLQLGRVQDGVAQLEEALALARQHGQTELEADALLALGKTHHQLQQTPEAIQMLQTAVSLAATMGYRKLLFEAHEQLAAIYEENGDPAQALAHYKQFHAVRESLFNDENGRKIRSLELLHQNQATQKEAGLYASLYAQEQHRRLLAETLQTIGQALTSTLELDEVLGQILAQLALLVPYDRASLLMKEGEHLVFRAARGFPDDERFLQIKVPLSAQRAEDVFYVIYESKRPLALRHVATYTGWQQVADLPIPKAWLGVPLIHKDEVIGMLSLVRETDTPFDEEAIAVATSFAAQAAIALENARLYNYARRFNEQLEYEVRQRTKALQEAYERLERLDQAKSDFISVTAHELRTPLTVMKGYSQLLQKLPNFVTTEQQARLLNGIVHGVDRLQTIVNNMLLMVKIDSHTLKPFLEPVSLYEAIGAVVVELAYDLAERQQTILLHDGLSALPPVLGDEDLLKVLFRHLLVNAIKYTPDGGEVHVDGRFWHTPPRFDWPTKGVEIVIRDTGIGIPQEALTLIFDKFYRIGPATLHSSGQTKFKGGGPGLGLTIARGIVEAHRGLIWAESPGYNEETCPGATFHVVLPQS